MSDIDLSKYVKDLQALFINIAWKTGYKKSGKTFSDFDNLTLEKASIMRNGILFIWVDKEIMGDLITYMDRMKFHYIENFTVVHVSTDACLKNLPQGKSEDKKNKVENNLSKISGV